MEARLSQKVQKSGRTTAQVVVEKELELYSHIIGPDTVLDHPETCRCNLCWHRACDRAIKAGQEALDATSQAGAAGVADGDELQAGAGADKAGVPWQD